MYISGCLKVQVDDQPAEIFSFQDFLFADYMVEGFSIETLRAMSLIQKNMICSSPYAVHGNLPQTLVPTFVFGIFNENESDGVFDKTPVKAFGLNFETLKSALVMAANSSDSNETITQYDISIATKDNLQSIMDNYARETFIINFNQCVVRYMPVTQQELDDLNNNAVNLIAPFVDAFPSMLADLTSTSESLESQGLVKAKQVDDYIEFKSDYSFHVDGLLSYHGYPAS